MSRPTSRFALVLALPLVTAGALEAMAQTTALESGAPAQSCAEDGQPCTPPPAGDAQAPQATPPTPGTAEGHGPRRGGERHDPRGEGRPGFGSGHGGFGPGRMGPPMGGMRELFAEADANDDGALTQDELDGFRSDVVSDADASGDGAIDLDEFETIYLRFTRERMVDMFQELDADGDGSISEDELDDRFGGVIERLDRNDDGKLSVEDRGRR